MENFQLHASFFQAKMLICLNWSLVEKGSFPEFQYWETKMEKVTAISVPVEVPIIQKLTNAIWNTFQMTFSNNNSMNI